MMLKFSDVFPFEMSQEVSDENTRDSSAQLANVDNNVQEIHSPASASVTSSSDFLNSSNEEHVYNSFSWHEHVYRKLTTRPTPHYIENILGISMKTNSETDESLVKQRIVVNNIQENTNKIVASVQETNEPLNLSIKSDLKVRIKNVKGKIFLTYFHQYDSNFWCPCGHF